MSQPPQGPPPRPPQEGWGAPGPSPYGPSGPSGSSSGRSGGRRRGILLGAGGVLLVALVGGGVWGATSFFSTGAQPAEALPADTLAYVAVDLDPSGGQKLEALRTLEKFPILAEEVDLDADADLKEAFFGVLQDSGEGCEGLSYDDDLAAWLGDRLGFAAVPGEDEPSPVGVVQVTDAGAAEDGLQALANCAATGNADESGESDFGFVIGGDWAVIAQEESIAQGVVDDAGASTLADDEDYGRWVEAAGDPGVLTAYAAPSFVSELTSSDFTDELPAAFEDFDGAALTVRFADEGLEVEAAASSSLTGGAGGLAAADNVEDVVAGLPDDTAALFAFGLEPGWAGDVLDQLSEVTGLSADELASQAEQELGIEVPEDLEVLLGDGAALAVSPDVDLEGIVDGSTPPEEAQVGARVLTEDPDASEAVLDELRGALPDDALVASETGDEMLVVSPSSEYRSALLEGGDLGGQDAFADAVPQLSRSGAVIYVDLDVLDDYDGLIDVVSGDPRVAENLEPLAALGASGWVEDDVTHTVIRISTDAD